MNKRYMRRTAGAVALVMLGTALLQINCTGRVAAAGAATPQASMPPQSALPRTRAELSNYTVTSSHADVVAFIDSLRKLNPRITVGSIGKTTQGRDLPYVIASRPPVSTPEQARQLGRPIVYIQGNIHSGEVEGKEALQAALRDLLFSPRPNALDSVVLIAVPNYNADGNENLGPQARARGAQNGPEMVGTRPNSQGLNLNRDYVKADAPETRGSLQMFNAWDPDVFVDLHTSNGSFHGYALTYAPPLAPASVHSIPFTRDTMLPEIRARMKSRHGFETFDYGNFGGNCDTNCQWRSYEHTPRYGTNYYGLRGRVSILSEAFSHDPFETRVKSTYAFVQEILSVTAARARQIRALSRRADSLTTLWGSNPLMAPEIAIRAAMSRPAYAGDVLVLEMQRTAGDTTRYEAGLQPGMKRTGRIFTRRMQVYDRFYPVLSRKMAYGYAVDSAHKSTLDMLRMHGVRVQQLQQDWTGNVEIFRVDTLTRAPRPFEGHSEITLGGTWRTERRTIPRGHFVVSSAQPLGILAMYLLEPQSDDGLSTWNFLEQATRQGGDFPVLRIGQPLQAGR